MYTLGTAAKAVGKAKSTISKDVKRGKISATRNPDGSVSIDPAELFRVYAPVLEQATGARTDHANDWQPAKTEGGNGVEVELLRERVAEQAKMIADLQRRLDLEADERRRVQERLNGLLTHRQAGSVPPVALRSPWWQRWIRG
jgi:hypothetical protein